MPRGLLTRRSTFIPAPRRHGNLPICWGPSICPPLELKNLDTDIFLAAQGAANAIQVSLSGNNDHWWNDLSGEEPINMDRDLLLQQYPVQDVLTLT